MSDVVLVCPEPLGHRQPAGVGIRFIEFARHLVARGHSVSLFTPDGAMLDGTTAFRTSPEALHEVTSRADCAIVQGHVANDYFAHAAEIPTVVDLYDPFIIENLHYSRTSLDDTYRHDRGTLMRSLARGDFFLCASDAQRMFYLGLLLASGRISPERFHGDPSLRSLIEIVPFGVPPPRASRTPAEPRRLLFGGIYDWYEPVIAIEAVAIARQRVPGLTLTFNEHPNAALTPQKKATDAKMFIARRKWDDFVAFEPWAPYAEREAYYRQFDAAILTFRQSLETDLSMRTRVYDYLWSGLPIITSSANGTNEIIEKYGTGLVVDSDAAEDFADRITELVHDAARYRSMVDGTHRFVEDHQWATVLAPLFDFCSSPAIDATRRAATDGPDAELAPLGLMDRIRRKLGSRL